MFLLVVFHPKRLFFSVLFLKIDPICLSKPTEVVPASQVAPTEIIPDLLESLRVCSC